MGQSRYIVGIDLGTTNSAAAYVDLGDPADPPPIRLFSMPQLMGEFRVEAHPGLPSFLYLPGPHDLPVGATALPWAPQRDYAVGVLARDQGALVPARLIASAKSWLCHNGVDRQSPILPWGSPSEVPHLSPVEVASHVLQHIREAWDHTMSNGRPEWTMGQSDAVLTVPASFDEVARELTVAAAREAGLSRLTLLEEPQAAFYSWVRSQGDFWREELSVGQQVLVCDVGGGTTDFSLIAVRGEDGGGEDGSSAAGEMSLERVAVGDHLMLGGDNMDLALARHLEKRLVKRAGELDARQWGALVHSCRKAKEALLGLEAEDRFPIQIAGRGSKVIGGSLRIDLFQDEVLELVLDGFFPRTGYDEEPSQARVGLQELGLPYAQDPAVTRNLAAFLKRHDARPDAVLFNGGAMKAAMVQDRLVETLGDWFGFEPIVLESRSLDLAVALGAATYGLVRAGQGVRIRGGTARAYYVGVSGGDPQQRRRRQQGVCLIPFGVEEGEEVRLGGHTEMEVLTDRPVTFPLFSSTAPLGHDPGDVVEITEDVFIELPPLHTVLNFNRGVSNETVPVSLEARLTELGTLQMWCAARQSKHRWDLEFSLRDSETPEEPRAAAVGDASLDVDPRQQALAADAIRDGLSPAHASPRTMTKELEQILDADRLSWPGPLIRTLWAPLWESAGCRRVSAEHESTWLNLAGILLRPGFGDPLDPGRIESLWTVFRNGMEHGNELWCRIAWWVLWRRVSGGLAKGQQLELSNKLAPPLLTGAALKAAGKTKKGKKGKKAKKGKGGEVGLNRQELAEMWRAVASLERIPAVSREGLGDTALRNAVAGRGAFAYWALGRFGARIPLYGPLEETASQEKVEGWLERLLSLDWSRQRGIALAVAQLGRLCGDPARDISERLRAKLVDRLRDIDCPDSLLSLLLEVKVMQESERGQMFGDALPTGLRLA